MPEQQAQGQQQAEGPSTLRTIIQSVIMFIAIQTAIKGFFGSKQASADANTNVTGAGGVPQAKATAIPPFEERPAFDELQGPYSPIPSRIAPIWPIDSELDLRMYISSSLAMPALRKAPAGSLVLEEKGLRANDGNLDREVHTTFDVPVEAQHNGTLWAHFYVSLSDSAYDPTEPHYDPSTAYHFARPLNEYLIKRKPKKVHNLISGELEDGQELVDDIGFDEKGKKIVSYFHPNFTLSLVPMATQQSYVQLHPAMREWIQLESTGARDRTGQNGWHYPVIYMNTFWQLQSHMTELNDTVKRLPLNINLNTMSWWKLGLISSMDFGMRQSRDKAKAGETLPGGGDGSEFEEIKRILIDSNIYLLSTTIVVGIFHTLFEMLAFKSDVSHFRNKKDNVGISVRTILANVFMQIIVLLYLLDNSEATSWMIFFSQGMGILLEAWKVTRMVDVRIRPTPPDSTAFPWKYLSYTVVFEDKHKLSETEKKTQEYDEIAFRYMYWVAIPLLGAYAAYSLYYESHKSWYSFIITTLVGSVYAYGFLLMVPSLYINYRLQSVAHMPGRAMTYKFLNTFIDDLFAFTVKMPILHRLATLRDDVIFFVYLYQCWVYKVDYTRVNEFGQGGDDAPPEPKEQPKPAAKASEDTHVEDAANVANGKSTGASTGTAKKRK